MVMPVMDVRHMRVAMPYRLMAVGVAVYTLRHHLVVVIVVSVIVAVRMLVFQRLVLMFVVMRLGQMQGDTPQHQQAAQRHAPAC